MKGVVREKVSLIIGNYFFRKRKQLKNGSVVFSSNGCEAQVSKNYLSEIETITKDGTYELVQLPCFTDHSCWADGQQVLIRKAKDGS